MKDLYSSYKDLPLSIYQIQTKYRDEARPRAGLLRAREFVMKDSYSFDIDEAGLDKSYQAHRDAYVRIFDRLGFHYVIVEAMAGAMGGSKSEEFLATAEVGEDTYVRCTTAAMPPTSRRSGSRARSRSGWDGVPAAHAEDTPDTPTIETLVAHLNERFPGRTAPWTAGDTLKNVVVTLVPTPTATASRSPSACPATATSTRSGSSAQVEPAEVEAFDEKAFAEHPGLVKGYIGPVRSGPTGTDEASATCSTHASPRAPGGSPAPNEPGATSSTSSWAVTSRATGRSRPPRSASVTSAPTVTTSSRRRAASRWATSSSSARSMPRRSTSRSSTRTASSTTVVMGSYGVGVSRAVACVVEGNHDELGLVWPRELSPADVHLVATARTSRSSSAAEDRPRSRQTV